MFTAVPIKSEQGKKERERGRMPAMYNAAAATLRAEL